MNEDGAPRRILIVEDASSCAELLETALLLPPSMSVTLAPSAEDALSAILQIPFHAVITDVNLPGMDGITLVSTLRAHPNFKHIPIVVISAAPNPDVPADALCAGADAFFPKPFSPAAVRRKLEELLNAT